MNQQLNSILQNPHDKVGVSATYGGYSLTVGQQTLTLFVAVRFRLPLPIHRIITVLNPFFLFGKIRQNVKKSSKIGLKI